MTALEKTAAFLLAASLVAGCKDETQEAGSAQGARTEAQAQAGVPGPSRAAADEECYELFLPKDVGLVNAEDLEEAVLAVLEFKREGGSLPVTLRMKKTKFVSRKQDGHTFLHQPMEKKMEEIVEFKPGEEAGPKVDPFYFNGVMGDGIGGLDGVLGRLAEEIEAVKTDFGAEISAGMNVPVGLVMEGYRRSKDLKGVLSVGFLGMVNPLEETGRPVRALPANVVARFDQSLMHDQADGFPAIVVSVSGGAVEILSPATPDPAAAGSQGPLSAVSRSMRRAAAISRPENDQRLSNAWLVVRMQADAPCTWLWAFMQEAVQPGVGIWKIRVLLPKGHAYMARD